MAAMWYQGIASPAADAAGVGPVFFCCHPIGIRGCLFWYSAAMAWREYDFFVYIAASRSYQLYIGFANGLRRRMAEQNRRQGRNEGFHLR